MAEPLVERTDKHREFPPSERFLSVDPQKLLVQIGIIVLIVYLVLAYGFGAELLKQNSTAHPNNVYFFLALTSIITALLIALTIPNQFIKNYHVRVLLVGIVTQFSFIVYSALISGVGVAASLIILLFSIIFSILTLPKARTDFAINNTVIVAIIVGLLNILSPFTQITIPALQIYLPIILGILIMIFIVLLAMESVAANLRIKMTSALLTITLIPLVLLALVQTGFTQNSLQNQNYEGLQLAGKQAAGDVESFIKQNLDFITLNSTFKSFADYLVATPVERQSEQFKMNTDYNFNLLQKYLDQNYALSTGLLDKFGQILYDTNSQLVGHNESTQSFFQEPIKSGKSYVSPLLFDDNNQPYIVFSGPIFDAQKNILGVLRVRYNATVLQNKLEARKGLYGPRSYPVLLDENLIRLADVGNSALVFQPIVQLPSAKIRELVGIKRLPQYQTPVNSPLTYIPEMERAVRNLNNRPFFSYQEVKGDRVTEAGAVTQLQYVPWSIVYVQHQQALFDLFDQQNRLALIVAILIAGLVSLGSSVISRLFSSPIINLTSTAEQIASGDLNALAVVTTGDEIGILGNTFNLMTSQMRSLINTLEDRVRARTRELAEQNESLKYRTQQLQTVSEVARNITTTQELEGLLTKVTQLVSERFNFYHAGIFLLDQNKEYAILRAANSEGGKRMLARQHKLRVGEVGIVGYVAGHGIPRIATDVGNDAVYFNNPDLPLTRSEMALPLRIGDEVIGALDVQSTIPNAFSEEDVELFDILADQVAIAIFNNRLYAETSHALEEIQSLHRQYLRMEWTQEADKRTSNGYQFTPQGVVESEKEMQPAVISALETGQVYIHSRAGSGANDEPATLAVPILLRGEPIGVIHLQEPGSVEREWTENDLATVQAVADQMSQALETARLFEQTLRRAERERKVLEITSKIRSTNNLQSMLQIAVQELQTTFNATRTQVIVQQVDPIEKSMPDNPPAPGNGHE